MARLAVQVVAQNDAAKAQIGLGMEQNRRVAVAYEACPKWHDLHVSARTGAAEREFAECAFHLYQSKHQRHLQPRPLGLRDEFLQTLWYEAKRAGLEVALVLGLVHHRLPIERKAEA